MAKCKNTKRAFLCSVLSMIVCLAMLIGSTFAWFSDSVVSGTNKIVAGNLDVELYHQNADVTTEEKVTTTTPLFVKKGGSQVNWEPGVMVYENFTVKNVGSLALKYKLKVNVGDYNTVTVNENGTEVEKSLKDVLQVAILDSHLMHTTRDAVLGDQNIRFEKKVSDFEKVDTLNAGEADKEYAMIIYWKPTEKDNDYNINNTKIVNPVATKAADSDNALFIELGVKLEATQHTVENDSFDDQYDKNAWLDMIAEKNENGTYTDGENTYVKEGNDYLKIEEDPETKGIFTTEEGKMYIEYEGKMIPVTPTSTIGVYDSEKGKVVTNEKVFSSIVSKGGNVIALTNIHKDFTGTVFSTNALKITNISTPTIIDLNNKEIKITSPNGQNGILAETGTNVTFSNGTIIMNKSYGSDSPVIKANKATVTLNNMSVKNVDKSGICVMTSFKGRLIINDSTISGGDYSSPAVYSEPGTTVVISNSTIIGSINSALNGRVELRGGDYTKADLYGQTNNDIVVYSGTFSQDPTKHKNRCTISSGSKLVENDDGTWSVIETGA